MNKVIKVDVLDAINDELSNLRLCYAFLSGVADSCIEEKQKFLGEWNIKFFDAALIALGRSIDNIEKSIKMDGEEND